MTVYTTLHILGTIILFQSLGAFLFDAMNGGTKATGTRLRMLRIMSGAGLLLLLVSGFGMLARLEITWPLPGWAWGMILIWLVLGSVGWIIKKYPASAAVWWRLSFVLGALAAFFGIVKPF